MQTLHHLNRPYKLPFVGSKIGLPGWQILHRDKRKKHGRMLIPYSCYVRYHNISVVWDREALLTVTTTGIITA